MDPGHKSRKTLFPRRANSRGTALSSQERELTDLYLKAIAPPTKLPEETLPIRTPTHRTALQTTPLLEHINDNELDFFEEKDEESDEDEDGDGHENIYDENEIQEEADRRSFSLYETDIKVESTWTEADDFGAFDAEKAAEDERYHQQADGILHRLAAQAAGGNAAPSTAEISQIKAMRQALLERQKQAVDSVKARASELCGAVSRHISVLRRRLKWIMEEGLEAERTQDGKDVLLEESQTMLGELKSSAKELEAAKLEKYFPSVLDWKLRLSAGDGSFLGVRDVDIDAISANFTFSLEKSRGRPACLEVRVSAINATVTVFDFQIKGSNLRARFSKLLLTPTVNCLRINFTGDYNLVLDYEPGLERNNYQACWRENKEKSKLKNLHIRKQMSGVSALQLPHKLVEALATSILPSALNDFLMKSFRAELGEILQSNEDHVDLSGSLRVQQLLPSLVWRAPLASNTANAAKAREALGMTYDQSAWLDFVIRSKRAQAAGFRKKGISLHRLLRWRREFALYAVDNLSNITKTIEMESASPNGGPSLIELLHRVDKLAAKEISCRIGVDSVRVNVGLEQIFKHISSRRTTQFATIRADTSAERQYFRLRRERSKAKLRELEAEFRAKVVPYLGPRSALTFDGEFTGGWPSGRLTMQSRDFRGVFRLPERFTMNDIFGQPPIHHEGEEFVLSGSFVPSSGAYVVSMKPRSLDSHNEEDPGMSASLKGLNIQISPNQYPGFIVLNTEQLKLWTSNLALSELTRSFLDTDDPESTLDDDVASNVHTVNELEELHLSRGVVNKCREMYRAACTTIKSDTAGPKRHGADASDLTEDFKHPLLPRMLLDPAHLFFTQFADIAVELVKENSTDDQLQLVVTSTTASVDDPVMNIQTTVTLHRLLQN